MAIHYDNAKQHECTRSTRASQGVVSPRNSFRYNDLEKCQPGRDDGRLGKGRCKTRFEPFAHTSADDLTHGHTTPYKNPPNTATTNCCTSTVQCSFPRVSRVSTYQSTNGALHAPYSTHNRTACSRQPTLALRNNPTRIAQSCGGSPCKPWTSARKRETMVRSGPSGRTRIAGTASVRPRRTT